MFEQDYLMRMILQLIEAIRRSLEEANGETHDPAAAADMLEAAVGTATDIDGSVLLSLAPESIADILKVSGTDAGVAEYIGRSLYLESSYLDDAHNDELSQLRHRQAQALAASYGFSLDEEAGPQAAMDAFLEEQEKARAIRDGKISDQLSES